MSFLMRFHDALRCGLMRRIKLSNILSTIEPIRVKICFSAEVAEARFKEVMTSYEAIKTERKNMK